MASDFVDKLLDKASDRIAGLVILMMSTVIGAGLLATWPIIKSLDRLSLFLIGLFIMGIVPMTAYYAAIFASWWKIHASSFMKLDFDQAINTVPGYENYRRMSLVIKNVHRSKTLSGAILQLNYLQPCESSLEVDGAALQFSNLPMQPEHFPEFGRTGIDLRPGQHESFICLSCHGPKIEVRGYSSQTGKPQSFRAPLVEYRIRFTASATNAVAEVRDFELRRLTDGTYALKSIGVPSRTLL